MTMQMYMADERRAAREDGVREGIQKGIREGILASINSLMKTTGWPVEQAMKALNIPDNERAQYAALLQDE